MTFKTVLLILFSIALTTVHVSSASAKERICPVGTDFVRFDDVKQGNTTYRTPICRKPATNERSFPITLLKKTTPFIQGESFGIVKVAVRDAELEFGVDINSPFFANYIETGDNSGLTVFSLSGERLRILENTTVEFGEVLDTSEYEQNSGDIKQDPNYDISIKKLNGKIRFDVAPESIGKVEKLRRLAFEWYKKLGSRRFRVHTPEGGFAPRGTDFTIEGHPDGTMIISILEGEVEFTPFDGGNSVVLGAGDEMILPNEKPVG